MKQMYKSLFLILAVGLSACKMESLEDPIIVADIDREFIIDMIEILDISENLLTLRIETIRNENCLNATIEHTVQQSGNQVEISLKKISNPVNCQSGQGPAKTTAKLDQLTLGNYNFSIDLLETITNEGVLVNGASSWRLNLKTENGIQILHNELLKIPEYSIWGWVSYSGSTQQVAARVLDDISQLSSGRTFEPGYYGHFSLNADQISIRETPDNQYFLPILTHIRPENIPLLQEMLHNYRSTYQADQLSIKLTNWQGQTL